MLYYAGTKRTRAHGGIIVMYEGGGERRSRGSRSTRRREYEEDIAAKRTLVPEPPGPTRARRISGIVGTVLGALAVIYLIVVFGIVGTAALHHGTPSSLPAPTSGQ